MGWQKISPSFENKNTDNIRRKNLLQKYILLLISLLIIIGSIVGLLKNQKDQINQETGGHLEKINHLYVESLSLIEINPVRSRELISQTENELDELKKLPLNTKEKNAVFDLNKKIAQLKLLSAQQLQVQPQLFYTLDLLKFGGSGKGMFLFENNLVILDSKNQSIYQINIKSKSGKIIYFDPEVGEVIDIARYGNETYLLFKDGISSINGERQEKIISFTEEMKPVKISAYAGNLFILDPQANQIWKYIKTDAGFSDKQYYLIGDYPEIREGEDIKIDGSLFLVNQGKVYRFKQGYQDFWQISGPIQGLKTKIKIFTSDALTSLYIYDFNKRIIKLTKEGEYLSQYQWDDNLEISDFIVSEEINKILMLVDGKIYSIGLVN